MKVLKSSALATHMEQFEEGDRDARIGAIKDILVLMDENSALLRLPDAFVC